jgi:hypothetical protein
MAALKEDPTGSFKKGDAFEVYDAQGPIKVDCRVKGFASLNRGIPHFSYFQQAEAPGNPGCGKAWPVAELDCSLMNTRARESNLAFVLPRGSPAPRYLPASPRGASEAERTLAVLDLEGDGGVERLTRDEGDTSRVALVREDGSRVTATFLPQCDPNY